MAVQNRKALDLLLTGKGVACFMFGEQRCTFIPNNTAADGSGAKACEPFPLSWKNNQVLIMPPLALWLAFSAGIGLVSSLLVSLAVMVSTFVLCGFCCIPCIWSLCEKTIETAIRKHTQDKNAFNEVPDDDEGYTPSWL